MMHELMSADFRAGSVRAPSLAEQIRIGALFARLGFLITLHQREPEGKSHFCLSTRFRRDLYDGASFCRQAQF